MQQQPTKDKSILSGMGDKDKEGKSKMSAKAICTPDGGSLALAIRTGTTVFRV